MKTLAQLLGTLPQARVVGDAAAQDIRRVHTDTRSLCAGDLFVALRGERFDAHDFLPQAAAAGAVAALAEQGLAAAGLAGAEVPDSRLGLGQLAAAWRAQFDLPLIAVTGSNGKTTVTQMLASVLRAAAGEGALATEGNFNNDIGVPLTLLRLLPQHRLAVVELGMNHPGEIAGLAVMAAPTVALVNNAQREHQEFMATVEAVARENATVFDALPADGVAVFPSDDEHTPLWRALAAGRRCSTFSDSDRGADVWGEATWSGAAWQLVAHTPAGGLRCSLRIAGRHNLRNALAAVACALAAGVALPAIAQGLSDFEPVKGRSRTVPLVLQGRAITLVDDTYNANPDSVRAAIDVLASLPGPQLLVLGDMGEVGDQGLAFHQEVLAHALDSGITQVLCTGDWFAQAAPSFHTTAAAPRLLFFTDVDALVSHANAQAVTAGSVLVKGSRFMRMERVVQALQDLADTTAGGVSHVA
ncbi:UDP-N-acetylmuramoyl-tripeptide--D-alanyl-D-alanine ligase [Hydrogenophaga sp. OTU3427]|uniref:UDP-N-acetylmuramoyl-tripeptide--D-alanyl-D- alanine ligase n=1 Tax=Hydrogenophaga sp. OTU3427 TaxID=3043856 RepID=UPI00313E1B2A